MGKRGPAKMPTKLRQLNNNASKRPINQNEPKPAAPAALKTPKGIGPAAQKVWRILSKKLLAAGLLTEIDTDLLTRYCVFFIRYQKARDHLLELDRLGLPYYDECESKYGGPTRRLHPEVKLEKDYHEILYRIEQQFGMSPSARTSLEVELSAGDSGDALDAWRKSA
ncbi:MAG: phage terminase small subunit P27 family [Candidatus Latescibacteria bacterium]|nr:phage terminase small subunit P27 family [Candidatus Latescibacterota bacterium]NIO78048.1 phage terminase small subunit P27 family [Candidatus Latescibacterota bacterium]